MSFLWSVEAAKAGPTAFQLLRFGGLLLCSPLSFSLCSLSLGLIVLAITQGSICHIKSEDTCFQND